MAARQRGRNLNKNVELDRAVLKISHRTAVRSRHELTEGTAISCPEEVDRFENAFIFSDDMGRAAFHEIGKIGCGQLCAGHIAQGSIRRRSKHA